MMQKISSDMEGMWRMQALKSNGKVDLWKRKIDQVAEEAAALQLSLEKCDTRHQRWQVEEDHRKELLHRRVAGLAVTNFDIEAEGRERVHRSKQVAEEAYQTGVSVLGAMSQQRDRLKSAHRKVLDVLNTIGLSDSVLRIAERRIAVDKLIAYGGMAAVTLVLIVLYWWFKP
jgi:Golgi SNAP receptor complex protein 2